MRIANLALGISALALTACGQGGDTTAEGKSAETPPASTAGLPTGPTPGLWRVTTRMTGVPAEMGSPQIETCVREAKFEPPPGAASQTPGMTCDQQSFRREGDAMVGHSVCTSTDGVRTVVDTRVTGDFSRNYTMEVKSTMTPAPTPSMAEVSMVMTAERLGDCPAESAAE